jgi:predicted  nucleic acid-binding Zn-ribbon protein
VDKTELLARIQDLDLMIHEVTDPASKGQEEGLGFAVIGLERLKEARRKLEEQVDRRSLSLYERVRSKYGRAVVPFQGKLCLGCFMTVPTSTLSRRKEGDELLLCENCGRILYWL